MARRTSKRPPGNGSGSSIHFERWFPYRFSWVANEVSLCLYGRYHSRWGLSVVGWRIIVILAEHAPLAAKDLAQLTAMDPVQITRTVAELARLGFVTRRIDRADRRRVALRLTSAGEALYAEMLPYLQDVEVALLDGLKASERAQLVEFMDRIQANGRRFFITGDDGIVRLKR